MYEIEGGIEITQISRKGRPGKYPFADMKVGQSFFAPIAVKKLCGASHAWKKNHPGIEFTCRTVGGGARCWRIA